MKQATAKEQGPKCLNDPQNHMALMEKVAGLTLEKSMRALNARAGYFQEGKPLIINGGPENNPRLESLLASKEDVAAISFPLMARDRSLGVLNISKVGKGTPFSESDIEMVSIICRQGVMALENLKAMNEKAKKHEYRPFWSNTWPPR